MIKIPTIPRRVVTGYKDNIATVIQDGPVTDVMTHASGFVVSDAWATNSMPVDLRKSAEIIDSFSPTVHTHGTLLRYVQIPPDSKSLTYFEPNPAAPHPLMHQTNTLDYIIILSGEVYLVMEDMETLLKPGDIVIQCATNHAWSNRTDEPCMQLAILLDAGKA